MLESAQDDAFALCLESESRVDAEGFTRVGRAVIPKPIGATIGDVLEKAFQNKFSPLNGIDDDAKKKKKKKKKKKTKKRTSTDNDNEKAKNMSPINECILGFGMYDVLARFGCFASPQPYMTPKDALQGTFGSVLEPWKVPPNPNLQKGGRQRSKIGPRCL